MPRLNIFSRPSLLFLAFCAGGGCSDAAAPVLQVDLVAGVPMETGRVDIIVTTATGTSGSAMFFKDGTEHFTLMPPSPSIPMLNTSVAVDLPVGTSGVVKVRAETRSVMMATNMGTDLGTDMGTAAADLATGAGAPPPMPAPDAAGCTTATIVPGTLTRVMVMLMMPAMPCPP